GYFGTVGTALVSGRDVAWTDTGTAPRIVVVNESLARAFFPGGDDIGQRISIGLNEAGRNLEHQGLERDYKYPRLPEPTRRIADVAVLQVPEFPAGHTFVAEVRTARASAETIRGLRDAARAASPTTPIGIEPMEARVRDSLVRERLIASVAALLGACSLVLC